MKKFKGSAQTRPSFEKAFPYLLCIFIAYILADLAILQLRIQFLPREAPPVPPTQSRVQDSQRLSGEFYSSIISRNPFSPDGSMPDVLRPAGQEATSTQADADPVLSSLPLTLEGTIVLTNSERSIANINVKGKNMILPFGVGREIEGLAKIVSIERRKVIFRNLNNGRLEYLEMKNEDKLSFQSGRGSSTSTPGLTPATDIKKVSDNKFEIKRSDLNKYLSNMSSILMDAAMIPERDASGAIDCFKFVNIKPDSVYTALGFQVNDSICSVNGQKIDSAQTAMALFPKLQGSSAINIGRKRDGSVENIDYTIK